jgi:hypothetical protein
MKASLATRRDVGGFHLVEWLQLLLVDCQVIGMGHTDNAGQGNFKAVILTLSFISCHEERKSRSATAFNPRIPQEYKTRFAM